MSKPITKKQRLILNHLQKIQANLGYRPSYRELGKAVGLSSPATIFTHLKALEQKGYVRRDENGVFMPLQRLANTAMEVPLRGLISNMAPLANADDYQMITVPAQMLGEGEIFALRVQDDSLQNNFLLKNDIIVAEKADFAKSGDFIVGRLENNKVMVAHYYREATSIRLQPINPAAPPMFVQKINIEGIIKGIIRKFD